MNASLQLQPCHLEPGTEPAPSASAGAGLPVWPLRSSAAYVGRGGGLGQADQPLGASVSRGRAHSHTYSKGLLFRLNDTIRAENRLTGFFLFSP